MLGAGVANGGEALTRGAVTNFLAFGPFPANWTTPTQGAGMATITRR